MNHESSDIDAGRGEVGRICDRRAATVSGKRRSVDGCSSTLSVLRLPPVIRTTSARRWQALPTKEPAPPMARAAASDFMMPPSSTGPPHTGRISTILSRAGPIHAGAVIVPAVLAIAEKRGLDGGAVMRGIAVGAELMCRMSLVAPQATHKAGFHPTAIFGAPAAAAAVGAALSLDAETIGRALRHFRESCFGHHRISRRWKLDQAASCRRCGSGRIARGASGRGRLHRTDNGF